jgi:hypothetical protein
MPGPAPCVRRTLRRINVGRFSPVGSVCGSGRPDMAAWAERRLRDDDAERLAEAAGAKKGVATVTCATGQVCRASQRPTSRII